MSVVAVLLVAVAAATLQHWHELLSECGRSFPTLALGTTAARRPKA